MSLYQYQDLRRLHLEISSLCNAECPLCPRNFHGYPLNRGYQEHNMTLAEAQQIFPELFLKQLTNILINGNFGDMVMNPQTPDIVEYFRSVNDRAHIEISTNGGARTPEFWQRLAGLGVSVTFCIDGLEDTHSLYRRNTVWSTVLRNAEIYMAAGGSATWKFIEFDHNRHQIEAARDLSRAMGFDHFLLIDKGRNTGPVFDRQGQLVQIMGNYHGPRDLDTLLRGQSTQTESDQESWLRYAPPLADRIACQVSQDLSIYVNSLGEVYPCCYVGFNPKTYGDRHRYFYYSNQVIAGMITNNSALEVGLEQAMSWFDQVEQSWQKPDYRSGQLTQCNFQCGRKCRSGT